MFLSAVMYEWEVKLPVLVFLSKIKELWLYQLHTDNIHKNGRLFSFCTLPGQRKQCNGGNIQFELLWCFPAEPLSQMWSTTSFPTIKGFDSIHVVLQLKSLQVNLRYSIWGGSKPHIRRGLDRCVCCELNLILTYPYCQAWCHYFKWDIVLKDNTVNCSKRGLNQSGARWSFMAFTFRLNFNCVFAFWQGFNRQTNLWSLA